MEELSAIAAQGKPVYGETDLPEFIQGVAHRNSQWSQLKFSALPWWVIERDVLPSVVALHYLAELTLHPATCSLLIYRDPGSTSSGKPGAVCERASIAVCRS